jgi:hypothetical protein
MQFLIRASQRRFRPTRTRGVCSERMQRRGPSEKNRQRMFCVFQDAVLVGNFRSGQAIGKCEQAVLYRDGRTKGPTRSSPAFRQDVGRSGLGLSHPLKRLARWVSTRGPSRSDARYLATSIWKHPTRAHPAMRLALSAAPVPAPALLCPRRHCAQVHQAKPWNWRLADWAPYCQDLRRGQGPSAVGFRRK